MSTASKLTFADLEPEVQHHIQRIALGIRDLQNLSLVIEHVDREHRERRQSGDKPGDPAQQLIDVEHRRYFPAELEQRGDEFLIVRACCGLGHVVVQGA